MNIFKQEGFLNRLLGSSCIVKELYPKGSTPAFTDFCECKKCGGKVLSMYVKTEKAWVPSKKLGQKRLFWHKSCSSNCRQVLSDEGTLHESGHEYKVPRLYDFVLWRSIVGVVVLFAIIAPFVLNWHGFGNVFIPENMEISTPLKSHSVEFYLMMTGQSTARLLAIIFAILIVVGVLVQLLSKVKCGV